MAKRKRVERSKKKKTRKTDKKVKALNRYTHKHTQAEKKKTSNILNIYFNIFKIKHTGNIAKLQ